MRYLTLFLMVACLGGCSKNEQAIRSAIKQEQAIQHSVKQKTEYVEFLLTKIQKLMVANLKSDHEAALASVTDADGNVNALTMGALTKKYLEDLRLINESVKEARGKWVVTLQDDQNALALNRSLQAWFKTEVNAMKALDHNTDRVFKLIDLAFGDKKGK